MFPYIRWQWRRCENNCVNVVQQIVLGNTPFDAGFWKISTYGLDSMETTKKKMESFMT